VKKVIFFEISIDFILDGSSAIHI